jgi:hypothetical protein
LLTELNISLAAAFWGDIALTEDQEAGLAAAANFVHKPATQDLKPRKKPDCDSSVLLSNCRLLSAEQKTQLYRLDSRRRHRRWVHASSSIGFDSVPASLLHQTASCCDFCWY